MWLSAAANVALWWLLVEHFHTLQGSPMPRRSILRYRRSREMYAESQSPGDVLVQCAPASQPVGTQTAIRIYSTKGLLAGGREDVSLCRGQSVWRVMQMLMGSRRGHLCSSVSVCVCV
uniref:Putative secreted protein n=1 Tax=Anopheles marajoara TaxID=58244 RepID=A0A2M4C7P1_9DIPT